MRCRTPLDFGVAVVGAVDQNIGNVRIAHQRLKRTKAGQFVNNGSDELIEFGIVEGKAFGVDIIGNELVNFAEQLVLGQFFECGKIELIQHLAMQAGLGLQDLVRATSWHLLGGCGHAGWPAGAGLFRLVGASAPPFACCASGSEDAVENVVFKINGLKGGKSVAHDGVPRLLCGSAIACQAARSTCPAFRHCLFCFILQDECLKGRVSHCCPASICSSCTPRSTASRTSM